MLSIHSDLNHIHEHTRCAADYNIRIFVEAAPPTNINLREFGWSATFVLKRKNINLPPTNINLRGFDWSATFVLKRKNINLRGFDWSTHI